MAAPPTEELAAPSGPSTLSWQSPIAPAAPAWPLVASPQRYVFLDPIGEGSMGAVHAAWDRQLNRKVALKLMRTGHGEGAETSLLREAQALALLRHENVVIVHDVGTLGDRLFVAMEFVDGWSLREWLAASPRTWREVVRVFVAAGRGLAAAHAAGLVHRDFKPDNVLIRRDGMVRVADFGLAREVSGPAPEVSTGRDRSARPSTVTEAGTLVGTPAYMAPELLLGERADQRSDEYAFAAALYQGLYGQLPRRGTTLSELLDDPDTVADPPSRDVPGWVREVVLRGLRRLPEQRYPSMNELLTVLDRNPARRRRRVTVAAGLALAIVSVGALWQREARARLVCRGAERALDGAWDGPARTKLEAAFAATRLPYAQRAAREAIRVMDDYGAKLVASHADACEAAQIRREQTTATMDLRMTCVAQRVGALRALAGVLGQADAGIVVNALRAAQALPDARECDDLEAIRRPIALPADPTARARAAEIRQTLADGTALDDAGKSHEALPFLERADAAARTLRYRPLEAEAQLGLARAREGAGDLKAAEAGFRQTLLTAEEGAHDTVRARAATYLAMNIGRLQRRPTDARPWGALGLAVAERIRSPEAQARAHFALQLTAYAAGQLDEAVEHGRKALALYEQAFGTDSAQSSSVVNNLGGVELDRGHYDEAERHYRKALALDEHFRGPEHPSTVTIRANLAAVAYYRGHYQAAIEGLRTVVATRERNDGREHWRTAKARTELASCLLDAGDLEQALATGQQAVAGMTASQGPDHIDTGRARVMTVAAPLLELGRLREAAAEARVGLAIIEKRSDNERATLLYSRIVAARIAIARHRPAEASALMRRSLADARQASMPDGPSITGTLTWLSEAQRLEGKTGPALETAERALAMASKVYAPDSVGLVEELVAVGQARLATGDAVAAIEPLERALVLLAGSEVPPRDRAQARFALARSLVAAHRDRPRAIALARQARSDSQGDFRGTAATIDEWLGRQR